MPLVRGWRNRSHRGLVGIVLGILLDGKRDVVGIELFSGGKRTRGAAADAPDDVAEMLADDHLADVLVDQAVLAEEVIVEEMAERAVADVMQQAGDPHVLFHVGRGRALLPQHLAQRRVQAPGEDPGQVHGPQTVLEAAVLRRGIDPAGALELKDVPEALEPRGNRSGPFLRPRRRPWGTVKGM